MDEARLIELEIKLAYQEDLLQSLNKIVSGQQQQLQSLENSLTILHQRQQTLAENMASNPAETQLPPHY